MQRTRAIGAALALALCLSATTIYAQDVGVDIGAEPDAAPETDTTAEADAPPASDTERAREEFALGIACVEEHETRCAIDHFETALELHDAPAIRYNLASALFELEQYPAAARHVAVVLADPEAPEDIRGHSETLQAQLQARGGTIEVVVAGSTEGAAVEVDGEAIPASQHAAVVVAPGARVVTLTRGGRELARQEIEVAAGQQASVELVAPPTPEEAAAQAALETEDVPAGEPAFYEEWPFWVIVGTVAALIALGVVVGVVAAEDAPIEEPVSGNYDPGILRWD